MPYRIEHYSSSWWHLARLDLMGFMRGEGRRAPRSVQREAERLYGAQENEERPPWGATKARANSFFAKKRPVLARHHTPPWAISAPEYVAEIYLFLAEAGKLVAANENQEFRQAA